LQFTSFRQNTIMNRALLHQSLLTFEYPMSCGIDFQTADKIGQRKPRSSPNLAKLEVRSRTSKKLLIEKRHGIRCKIIKIFIGKR
jgi:hypothetical protein